jgi:violaxanthin de-epoxidase
MKQAQLLNKLCIVLYFSVVARGFVPPAQRKRGSFGIPLEIQSAHRRWDRCDKEDAERSPSFTDVRFKWDLDFCKQAQQVLASTLVSSILALTVATAATAPFPAHAADSAKIASCLFQKCQLPLLKCIANPKCLANVACINLCNGRADETECQIQCGDLWENDVVGEFNKCAVSDMSCVPQKPDDGSYPIPDDSNLVQSFDTKIWNGRW